MVPSFVREALRSGEEVENPLRSEGTD